MRMRRAAVVLLVLLILAGLPGAAGAQQPAPAAQTTEPPYRFSGLVFGDYYGFVQDHLPEWVGQHGFWFRRIYFTYDHRLGPKVDIRLRLEMNSNGTLEGGLLTPYVKDAYLRWAFADRHQLTLGIHPSLTFDFSESVWGLRHIEKAPLDLYRVDSSRETGVMLNGAVNQSQTLKYQIQYGNDAGQESETNAGKAVRAAARYETNPGWSIEGVFGQYARDEDASRTLAQVFAGWQAARARAGFQYSFQKRRAPAGTGDADVNLDIYSGFGVYHVKADKFSIFARVDRFDDPCADCGGIDYLPIDTNSPFTLAITGLEYYIHPAVRLSPNLEYVAYGTPVGTTPRADNDLVLRLTFYWVW
jgi:hypothetical protein